MCYHYWCMLSVLLYASFMLLIINLYSQSYHDLQSFWSFSFHDIILDIILQLSIKLHDEWYIFSLCFKSYSHCWRFINIYFTVHSALMFSNSIWMCFFKLLNWLKISFVISSYLTQEFFRKFLRYICTQLKVSSQR